MYNRISASIGYDLSPGGETGRRTGLKIQFLIDYEFVQALVRREIVLRFLLERRCTLQKELKESLWFSVIEVTFSSSLNLAHLACS